MREAPYTGSDVTSEETTRPGPHRRSPVLLDGVNHFAWMSKNAERLKTFYAQLQRARRVYADQAPS